MKTTSGSFIYIILLFSPAVVTTAQNQRDLRKEYADFRARANAEYAGFMRRAWQQYKALPEILAPKVPDMPKPPAVVPENEKDKPPENKPVPYQDILPAPVVIEQPKPVAPIPETPKPFTIRSATAKTAPYCFLVWSRI